MESVYLIVKRLIAASAGDRIQYGALASVGRRSRGAAACNRKQQHNEVKSWSMLD